MKLSDQKLPEQTTTPNNDTVHYKRDSGRRIIHMQTLSTLIDEASHHARVCEEKICFRYETWVGLVCYFTYSCEKCKYAFKVVSDHCDSSLPVNEAAVWGIIKGGGGYNSLFDFFKILDIPPLSYVLYKRAEYKIHDFFENSLEKTIKQNGLEEMELALQDPATIYYDGTPGITVTCDGGWGKRSYGHSYTSLSGCAVIIGNRTGKILHLGTRNKYCTICDRQQPKNQKQKKHTCFKNHNGTSSNMETDIIVEGFLSSQKTHNLIYNKMLGDQDSSCYATVKDAMRSKYKVNVEKINCVNHAIRSLNSKLYKMKNNTKAYSLKSRKWLEAKITKLGLGCKSAIIYNHQNNGKDSNWNSLRGDLLNVPKHVAGDHKGCRKYFCKKVSAVEEIVSDSAFWKDLGTCFSQIADLSPTLIPNMKSNMAESFMSLMSKYLGGKRKNFYHRNQFTTRVLFAGNNHRKGNHADRLTYKLIFNKSPKTIWSRKPHGYRLVKTRRVCFHV